MLSNYSMMIFDIREQFSPLETLSSFSHGTAKKAWVLELTHTFLILRLNFTTWVYWSSYLISQPHVPHPSPFGFKPYAICFYVFSQFLTLHLADTG